MQTSGRLLLEGGLLNGSQGGTRSGNVQNDSASILRPIDKARLSLRKS
jgi:hypothetical protein